MRITPIRRSCCRSSGRGCGSRSAALPGLRGTRRPVPGGGDACPGKAVEGCEARVCPVQDLVAVSRSVSVSIVESKQRLCLGDRVDHGKVIGNHQPPAQLVDHLGQVVAFAMPRRRFDAMSRRRFDAMSRRRFDAMSRRRFDAARGLSVAKGDDAVKGDLSRLRISGLPCHGHAECAHRSTTCRELGDWRAARWAAWLGHGHESLRALLATARVAATEASRARRLFADNAHLWRRQWVGAPHIIQA